MGALVCVDKDRDVLHVTHSLRRCLGEAGGVEYVDMTPARCLSIHIESVIVIPAKPVEQVVRIWLFLLFFS